MFQKSLSQVMIATAISIPMVSLGLQNALAQTEAVSFTLINNTSRTLLEFYASPPDEASWEEDILGVDVLEPGESTEIIIDDGREDCLYDFKGVLAAADDGSVGEGSLIQSAVSVCDGGTYEYSEE